MLVDEEGPKRRSEEDRSRCAHDECMQVRGWGLAGLGAYMGLLSRLGHMKTLGACMQVVGRGHVRWGLCDRRVQL